MSSISMVDFKGKKPTKEKELIPVGSVVVLNSDDDGVYMTVRKSQGGEVLCRWHNENKDICEDWFSPDELQLLGEDSPIEFNADFTVEEK
jgi:uncharacterized protein YodC (DUF2158 family)